MKDWGSKQIWICLQVPRQAVGREPSAQALHFELLAGNCLTLLLQVWLGEVERRMRSSVRLQVVEAIAAYATTPRPQWVRDWPAMVVLAVSAIYWSKECEEAISNGTTAEYLKKCSQVGGGGDGGRQGRGGSWLERKVVS